MVELSCNRKQTQTPYARVTDAEPDHGSGLGFVVGGAATTATATASRKPQRRWSSSELPTAILAYLQLSLFPSSRPRHPRRLNQSTQRKRQRHLELPR